MLGHVVARTFDASGDDVTVVTRRPPSGDVGRALAGMAVVSGVDARVEESIAAVLERTRPDVVINCIGVVKQRAAGQEAVEAIQVNSLLPHQLAAMCAERRARLVTVSTDCVFSGRTGGYTESDVPDPLDVYGRSKLLGEVHQAHAVTLRTSIIGLELGRSTGLVEWFLAQDGTVGGWDRALYSGLTTAEFSRVIRLLVHDHPELSGLWHVAGPNVDKHTLLVQLAMELGRDVEVVRNSEVVMDRTLDAGRFNAAVGYQPPSWRVMLRELAGEIRARNTERTGTEGG
jgi:dTDP-4-dehydrorhamnose reductase